MVTEQAGAAVPAATPEGGPKPGRVHTGRGFDTCEAPSVATMKAWLESPYRVVGVYTSGVNRACANRGLTRDWVSRVHDLGWHFLPIHVGRQAPCATVGRNGRIDPARAAEQGAAEADEAVAGLREVGIAAGSPVYLDMEGYDITARGCSTAVLDFVSAWSKGVRAHGYLAGYYSSLDSGIADVVAAHGERSLPDVLWYADWDGHAVTEGDGAVPAALWTGNRRVHQYAGNVKETWGGVTMNIDRDAVDAPVAVVEG